MRRAGEDMVPQSNGAKNSCASQYHYIGQAFLASDLAGGYSWLFEKSVIWGYFSHCFQLHS
jgi:hypothetical protein